MKKLLLLTGLALALFLAAVYIFIPSRLRLTKTIAVDNMHGVYRALTDSSKWIQWWPGKEKPGSDLTLHDLQYHLKDYTTGSIFVDIKKGDQVIVSAINFIPALKNNGTLSWEIDMPVSSNPFSRVRQYLMFKSQAIDLQDLLVKIKSYYSATENLYGLHIDREQVKNASLVFTYDSSKGLPSTAKIYMMVDELKKYIAENNSHITDSPMVNITTSDSVYFLTRVAVPSDSILKSRGKISYKWMLGGGNILTAQVQGSSANINHAYKAVELYMNDYQLASPAIPFYVLTTNRLSQPDSSKWLSKVYYPVMYY